ncbi:MAG: helix-turn-helix domain-containing protein [Acidobacteria bacterium]|nr:helix-turn-helix domain-containing protein [Acidobacteriota bacterium]
MTENSKKRSASSQPKRSARKKFDIQIDPEVDAWSKKLFHPIKPIIDGLKEQAAQKSDPDIMSYSDKLSYNEIVSDTDIMSYSDKLSYNETMSDPENLSEPFTQNQANTQKLFLDESDLRSLNDHFSRSKDHDQRSDIASFDQKDQPKARSQARSELEIKSDPDISSNLSMTESERENISDPENISDSDISSPRIHVPLVRGELRIPNYILKGLLPVLSNSEFVVYLWLYFLSYGFGKDTCYVSAGKLADSVNLTDRTVFRALNSLETHGLIRRTNRHFLGKAGGLTFEVFLPVTDNLSDTDNMSEHVKMSGQVQKSFRSDSDIKSTIKDHDHDLKKITDHENKVMKIYYDLTANHWSQADHTQYEQIKDMPIETIETNMRIIAARSPERVRTFAYFTKSLRNASGLLGAKASSRVQRVKIKEFIQEVINAHVGGKLAVSDLEEKVRNRCEANAITFDKMLFNEILSSRQ